MRDRGVRFTAAVRSLAVTRRRRHAVRGLRRDVLGRGGRMLVGGERRGHAEEKQQAESQSQAVHGLRHLHAQPRVGASEPVLGAGRSAATTKAKGNQVTPTRKLVTGNGWTIKAQIATA